MSFNSAIPLITDLLPVSQKQLLANFQAISNAFYENHVALASDPNLQGQHNSLTLRPQNADPTTAADQTALYNKLVSGTPQMFFRPQSSGTPIQMTNSNYSVALVPGVSYKSSTFIAGPFTVYSGYIFSPANNTIVTLTPSTTLIDVSLTLWLSAPLSSLLQFGAATAINISGNQFTINYSSLIAKPFVIYYSAIGSS